ncbi:hypothetical protein PAPYR_12060 [Paratrimastix pyriformis]|uniref:Uncharacterized protein n=1 Tax=Paratrimastix pyriformis TaxID=342808 RepID=A0ABQ8U6I5_9EUKA|nr:hypothetical protein PAPYR_12060 [Paratrimastix pyriformis]
MWARLTAGINAVTKDLATEDDDANGEDHDISRRGPGPADALSTLNEENAAFRQEIRDLSQKIQELTESRAIIEREHAQTITDLEALTHELAASNAQCAEWQRKCAQAAAQLALTAQQEHQRMVDQTHAVEQAQSEADRLRAMMQEMRAALERPPAAVPPECVAACGNLRRAIEEWDENLGVADWREEWRRIADIAPGEQRRQRRQEVMGRVVELAAGRIGQEELDVALEGPPPAATEADDMAQATSLLSGLSDALHARLQWSLAALAAARTRGPAATEPTSRPLPEESSPPSSGLIASLREELAAAARDLETARAAEKSAQAALATTRDAAAALQSQLTSAQHDHEAACADLQSQLNALQHNHADLQANQRDEAAACADLQTQLAASQRACADLQAQLTALQHDHADLLQSQRATSQPEHEAACADLQAQLTASQRDCADLQAQLSALQRDHAEMQAQLTASQHDCADLHSQLTAPESACAGLQHQLAAIQRDHADLQSQLTASQRDCADLQAQLTASQREHEVACADLQSRLTASQRDCADLQAQLAAIQREHEAACADLQSRLTASQRDCADLQAQLAAIQNEHEAIGAELATSQRASAAHEAACADLQSRLVASQREHEAACAELQARLAVVREANASAQEQEARAVDNGGVVEAEAEAVREWRGRWEAAREEARGNAQSLAAATALTADLQAQIAALQHQLAQVSATTSISDHPEAALDSQPGDSLSSTSAVAVAAEEELRELRRQAAAGQAALDAAKADAKACGYHHNIIGEAAEARVRLEEERDRLQANLDELTATCTRP